MPGPALVDTAGALHHMVARGIERRSIFLGEEDQEGLLAEKSPRGVRTADAESVSAVLREAEWERREVLRQAKWGIGLAQIGEAVACMAGIMVEELCSRAMKLRSENSGDHGQRWRGIRVWPRLRRIVPWGASSIRWRNSPCGPTPAGD